jgi:PAS domain S-box-containing protein
MLNGGSALAHLSWKQIRAWMRCHLFARGERGIATIGIAAATILLAGVGASGWWMLSCANNAGIESRAEELQTTGVMLARSAEVMLSNNELTALRQLISETGKKLRLTECRIVLKPQQIIADIDPTRINQVHLPATWVSEPLAASPATGSGNIILRYPLNVEGRGRAYLQMAGSTSNSLIAWWAAQSGVALIGAAGLGVLLLVYRRNREHLVGMEVIHNALQSYGAGESSPEALGVDPRLGSRAEAWNRMLAELADLRQRVSVARANISGGARRSTATGLESACDAMSHGLILVDETMRVRFANGAASVFLNTRREDLAGADISNLIADEKIRAAIRAITVEKSRRPVTVEMEHQGGSGIGVLRFSIRPARKGDSSAATIVIEDVTQQRMAERARHSFITQVTHELRTPLTNIRLYTETAIDEGESNPASRANCLNIINQESRRLERIVGDMLSVAEVEAGSCTIRKDDVHIDVLCEELRSDYMAQAAEKQIKLEFALPPKMPVVKADRDKIAVALHNLLGNALKYTSNGGKVTVTVDMRDGNLVIEVTDTGIGIRPDEIERIFEKFVRSRDPRVGKIVGTGLGLTLAREVMRLHGGDVVVQSELDRGSTFTASLPLPSEAA